MRSAERRDIGHLYEYSLYEYSIDVDDYLAAIQCPLGVAKAFWRQ